MGLLLIILSVGIAFFIGFKFHEQKTKIKIRDIRDIQELKIATAYVRNPDGKTYQLSDPEKIKDALMNCDKTPVAFNVKVKRLQKLFMIFYEQGQNKILEVPFEIGYSYFKCEYGTSEELKNLLKTIPDPFAIPPWDTPHISDSNDFNAPSPENRSSEN